jgi:hypothetical protein
LAGGRLACLSCFAPKCSSNGGQPLPINRSTIVRGLIGYRMLVLVYASTRIGCTEHTEASSRSRSLARGAGCRCRDRPDLCQPSRTKPGEPDRRGARKTGSRPLLKYRRVFPGATRRRGGAEAVEGRSTTGKIAVVIPGRASSREPGIQRSALVWIPGSRH